jgi:hypothetical protein
MDMKQHLTLKEMNFSHPPQGWIYQSEPPSELCNGKKVAKLSQSYEVKILPANK